MLRQHMPNRVTTIGVVLNLSMSAVYAADPNSNLLNSLRVHDDDQVSGMTESGFSAILEMRYPAEEGVPERGMAIANCTMCWTAEKLAIQKVFQYDTPPSYRPRDPSVRRSPGLGGQRGRLTTWRPVRQYALSDGAINESLYEYEACVLDPEGMVVETKTRSLLQKDLVGKKNSIFEFYQFRMATGRGFSEHLDKIQTQHEVAGLRSVSAVGSFGPSFHGTWNIMLDPAADDLIREAVFTRSGNTSPLITSTSTGLISAGGLKIAQSGTLILADYEIAVEVLDLSVFKDGDELFFADIQNHLDAPLSPGRSEIIDLRGKEPVRTRITE